MSSQLRRRKEKKTDLGKKGEEARGQRADTVLTYWFDSDSLLSLCHQGGGKGGGEEKVFREKGERGGGREEDNSI